MTLTCSSLCCPLALQLTAQQPQEELGAIGIISQGALLLADPGSISMPPLCLSKTHLLFLWFLLLLCEGMCLSSSAETQKVKMRIAGTNCYLPLQPTMVVGIRPLRPPRHAVPGHKFVSSSSSIERNPLREGKGEGRGKGRAGRKRKVKGL